MKPIVNLPVPIARTAAPALSPAASAAWPALLAPPGASPCVRASGYRAFSAWLSPGVGAVLDILV